MNSSSMKHHRGSFYLFIPEVILTPILGTLLAFIHFSFLMFVNICFSFQLGVLILVFIELCCVHLFFPSGELLCTCIRFWNENAFQQIELNEFEGTSTLAATLVWHESFLCTFEEAIQSHELALYQVFSSFHLSHVIPSLLPGVFKFSSFYQVFPS